jgi:hypothetical protein
MNHRGVSMRTVGQLIDGVNLAYLPNPQQDELTKLCTRTSNGSSECEGCLEMQMHSLHSKRRLI